MNRIDGRIAVITGGTQGLGAAVARQFAAAGAAGLVLVGRDTAKGQRVADSIQTEHATDVLVLGADLADMAAVRGIIPKARDHFQRIDILVNAAGLTARGTLFDTTPEQFDRMLAINTRAPFFLIQDAAASMERQGDGGSIVNIGSVSGQTGQPFLAPYAVSKGALATLTRHAAFALLRNRIRVNQLDIGWMDSDGERAVQLAETGDPDALQRAARELPLERLLQTDEVARAVLWLASGDSGLMTGSVIHFDQSVPGGFDQTPPAPDSRLMP